MAVNNYDVLKRMGEEGKNIQLAPLSNVINAKKVQAGTQVTLGVGGNVIHGIMNGDYVGGFILADKKEFDTMKVQMEKGE